GRHRAGGPTRTPGALEGTEAAHLDLPRHADAEEPPVSTVEPGLLLGAQLDRAGDLQRLAEGTIVLATVVVLPGGRLVGKCGGRDERLSPGFPPPASPLP